MDRAEFLWNVLRHDFIKECLDKHGLEEMHGQDIRCDGAAQSCAFSILTKLQMAWKRTKYQEHPIGFCVMGIKRNAAREREYFGSDQRESNMHRRFLRPAITYALKKIYDMSPDNKLSLFHFYHDESSNLEQNELLVSNWMIREIMKDCGYCLDSFTNNIDFGADIGNSRLLPCQPCDSREANSRSARRMN